MTSNTKAHTVTDLISEYQKIISKHHTMTLKTVPFHQGEEMALYVLQVRNDVMRALCEALDKVGNDYNAKINGKS